MNFSYYSKISKPLIRGKPQFDADNKENRYVGDIVENFLKGLGCLLGGFAVWVLASIVAALGSFATSEINPFIYGMMVLGFFVMIGGPVVFWVIIPVKNRLTNKESPVFKSFCSSSGSSIELGSNFCKNCGTQL